MQDINDILRSLHVKRDDKLRKSFSDFIDELLSLQPNIALRHFKDTCQLIFRDLCDTANELQSVSEKCNSVEKEKLVVQDYCILQTDALSKLKQISQSCQFTSANEKEIVNLFQDQFKQRTSAEDRSALLESALANTSNEYQQYKKSIETRLEQLDENDRLIESLKVEINLANTKTEDAIFDRDKTAAGALKDKQDLIDAEAKIVLLENDVAVGSEIKTKLEDEINTQKSKIAELLNAAHELGEKYGALKLVQEADQIELQDANKRLKQAAFDNHELVEQLQKTEIKVRELLEQRASHIEKISQLSRQLQNRDDELGDLKLQFAEKTDEFKEKLAKKDAQIKILATQLSNPTPVAKESELESSSA